MTLRHITLIFLNISILGYLWGMLTLGLNISPGLPLTPLLTVSSFVFAVLHAGQREGWRKAAFFVVIVFITGLAFESFGVATGLVYGSYHYSDKLGPKFLGLVPYLIPLAWTFMVYPSMIIADRIIPTAWKGLKKGLVVAAISGVIMTAWDVAMDPIMVIGRNWVWEVKGAYFGIPLQNFAGWWLTTFSAVGLYYMITKKIDEKPLGIPDRWAVYSYTITATTTIVMALITGLGGPALAGFFAIFPWVLMGFLRTDQESV
ncbi:MAG: hypothetical protein C0401_03965 [Anaerolinea sp.]|nr:hypothetical protein [Anaerolinea sp.]